ncbi:uncharacterized protein [Anoplolepis gracilipes]|uniref:uncharacterized protein n=1 Tax=Anoplolepis gracilipes TaxID=354296 RepID=UPI003B9F36A4
MLLSTAIIQIQDIKGNWHYCRALLDNGSQSNFITIELEEKLGLKRFPSCLVIHRVGDANTETHSSVKVNLQSRLNNFKAEICCLTIRKIIQDLPTVSINRADIRIPSGITLADPEFMESAKIDMLIGVEIFWNITCIGQIKSTGTQPCWQKTHFGWIATGKVLTTSEHTGSTVCNLSINEELNHTMKRFWEIEHGARKGEMSLEEKECEKHFESNVKRNLEGRFVVKLPIKHEEMSLLGQSKEIAIRRFKALEGKLNRDPALKKEYAIFMHEYESLGHMREIRADRLEATQHYYMPHHCVIKEESSITRLRVIFDALCKTTSGVSLNDTLMTGPTLQQDLLSIVVRFRTFKYVLIADITKMYRQILIDESQVPLQRILWRNNPNEQLREFELLTLTYGTSPASFLAIKSLQTLAKSERQNYPIGAQTVLRDFYVDDLITGSNSMEGALQIRNETTSLLSKGGFILHKWTSNKLELIENIPDASITHSIRNLDKEDVFKTLGIQWNPMDDMFQYMISTNSKSGQRDNKRTILSFIAQIFDPLGLIGPVVLVAKLFI